MESKERNNAIHLTDKGSSLSFMQLLCFQVSENAWNEENNRKKRFILKYKKKQDYNELNTYWKIQDLLTYNYIKKTNIKNKIKNKKKEASACIGKQNFTSILIFKNKYGQKMNNKEDIDTYIRYGQKITLFTNFGKGGRYLTIINTSKDKKRVVWQAKQEDVENNENGNPLCQWIIRPYNEYKTRYLINDKKENKKNISNKKKDYNNNNNNNDNNFNKDIKFKSKKDDSDSDSDFDDDDHYSESKNISESKSNLENDKSQFKKIDDNDFTELDDIFIEENHDIDDRILRIGESILIESVAYPNHFITLYKNYFILSNNHIQRSELIPSLPSLQFAIGLSESKHLYQSKNDEKKSENKRERKNYQLSKIEENDDINDEDQINIFDNLPIELIHYIFTFFSGSSIPPHLLISLPIHKQRYIDSLPISKKRDGLTTICNLRLTCKLFSKLANNLITSIRSPTWAPLGNDNSTFHLNQFIYKLQSINSIKLRNLNSLSDDDIITWMEESCKFLYSLNIGGCNFITDKIVPYIIKKPIVHLSLAMTSISDYGVSLIIQNLPYLYTLNLYGMDTIRSETLIQLAKDGYLTNLHILNIRGCFNSWEFLNTLQNNLPDHCEVLVGALLQESVYTMRFGK